MPSRPMRVPIFYYGGAGVIAWHHGCVRPREATSTAYGIQVVGEGESMAGSRLRDLVFTVAVESSPVDGGLLVGIVLWIAGAPVERTPARLYGGLEVASFMLYRKTNHERSEL